MASNQNGSPSRRRVNWSQKTCNHTGNNEHSNVTSLMIMPNRTILGRYGNKGEVRRGESERLTIEYLRIEIFELFDNAKVSQMSIDTLFQDTGQSFL